MEEKVFPQPAVAGVLKDFIEARLHTDGLGPRYERNKELQKKETGSSATPIYMIVDPKTGEKRRLRAGLMAPDTFIKFLRGNVID